VDAHFQRQFSWQTTDNRGEESLASMAHMGHELMMMVQTKPTCSRDFIDVKAVAFGLRTQGQRKRHDRVFYTKAVLEAKNIFQ